MGEPVRLKLRSLLSDGSEPLNNLPPRTGSFCFFVRALVGPLNSEGEESFDFYAVSPEWLSEECSEHDVLSGRSYVITNRFVPARVQAFVEKHLMDAVGKDYNGAAHRLARWTQWEFEDYIEGSPD